MYLSIYCGQSMALFWNRLDLSTVFRKKSSVFEKINKLVYILSRPVLLLSYSPAQATARKREEFLIHPVCPVEMRVFLCIRLNRSRRINEKWAWWICALVWCLPPRIRIKPVKRFKSRNRPRAFPRLPRGTRVTELHFPKARPRPAILLSIIIAGDISTGLPAGSRERRHQWRWRRATSARHAIWRCDTT